MALGFMKNVFTFGRKQTAEESKQEDAIAPSEAEAVAAGEDAEAAPAEETPAATETLAEAKSADPWDDDSIVGGVVGPGSKPQEEAEDEAETLPAAETHEAEPEPPPVPTEDPEETAPAEAASAETVDAPKADSPVEPEKPAEAPEQPAIRNQGFEIVTGRKTEAAAPQPAKRQSWFQRLRAGLFRTSQQLSGQIAALFTKRKLDEDALEELEDLLIQADLGVETAMRITDTLSSERYGKDVSGNDVVRIMAGEITKVLTPVAKPLQLDLSHKPHVILVVGVNGTGKTTTIGKLAAKLTRAGLKVTLGAGDTFRAAAIEQLKIWSERTGAEFVGTKLGADAAGLAYDAFKRGQENGSDVVIIDTAGRLQNKAELMDELAKIVRVLGKLDPDAPHTVLQTLDATTGQNAMNQVEIFRNIAGVSGLVMTKLDGTARGGILVAIAAKHKLPVYFIGVGEGIDDLEPFEAAEFAEAIAGRQVEEQD
ncbi:signal recognition particle-docking protein FtsY [Martelella mediterranea]|uniref:signal recognition particle-docking protein FtsY n=1 Tax=Martelella mediterranea TaxID=293089 RepID=UPI001E297353|nr:signal recognition particle-docking protein FtsY [Martelella mediterranea]MCD1633621.1 signal recognition particle-docking protein FtsY [Martelella mediterranea]